MSEPEIARRCPSCGATIREVALFCPQCGDAQPSQKSELTQPEITAAAPEANSRETGPLDGADVAAQQSLSDTIAIERPEVIAEPTSGGEAAAPQLMSDTIAIERPEAAPKPPAGAGMRGTVGAKIQRATTLARGVEGDVIHRVQKVRHMSNVVWDEAGDDPGLRFVLVAVILFVLFLLIVLLNKFVR
jgi:hypothetical protein